MQLQQKRERKKMAHEDGAAPQSKPAQTAVQQQEMRSLGDVIRINAEGDTGQRSSRVFRYCLQFRRESPQELEKRKKMARQPYTFLDEVRFSGSSMNSCFLSRISISYIFLEHYIDHLNHSCNKMTNFQHGCMRWISSVLPYQRGENRHKFFLSKGLLRGSYKICLVDCLCVPSYNTTQMLRKLPNYLGTRTTLDQLAHCLCQPGCSQQFLNHNSKNSGL